MILNRWTTQLAVPSANARNVKSVSGGPIALHLATRLVLLDVIKIRENVLDVQMVCVASLVTKIARQVGTYAKVVTKAVEHVQLVTRERMIQPVNVERLVANVRTSTVMEIPGSAMGHVYSDGREYPVISLVPPRVKSQKYASMTLAFVVQDTSRDH